MAELLMKDEVYAIVGAAMQVYNELGHGFLEAIYQESFELECGSAGIPLKLQAELQIRYKGRLLKKKYVVDGLAYDQIVVEFKAKKALSSEDEAQLLNYLKASGKKVGVLLNFGNSDKLEWKRMVF
ncbi:MAG: GxxExxY protein [Planctomycetes bacterium]|nr:GxxExxY protein [Planctomycetota bacterium]